MLLKLFSHVAFLAALVLWIGGAGLLIKSRNARAIIIAIIWVGIGTALLVLSLR